MDKVVLTPKKKVAPSFLCYVVSILYIVVVILCVCSIVLYVKNGIFPEQTLIGAFGIGSALVFINAWFSWFISATLIKQNNKLLYTLTDPVSNSCSLAGETRITITSISKIKVKNSDIFVWGDIKKISTHHESHPKKVKIIEGAFNPDCYKLLNEFVNKQ